eukprot:Amastigsp_a848268_214.p1 type:complete len:436 gc:universal Amastigsp_a848268_214:1328-21(-)
MAAAATCAEHPALEVEDLFFVRCDAAAVNTRTTTKSILFWDPTTGTALTELELRPPGPHCPRCSREFDKHSALFAHQAKPCDEPTFDDNHPKVRISFPSRWIDLVEPLLAALKFSIESSQCIAGSASFLVPRAAALRVAERLLFCVCNAFNLETWISKLPPGATPSAAFYALSDDDMATLQKLYRLEMGSTLSRSENERVSALTRRVQSFLDELPFGGPYFCRTSSRSPKDGATLLASRGGVAEGDSALCVRSAAEALRLVGMSMRVFSDFAAQQRLRVPGCHGEVMNLIFRPWVSMPPESEWRCFVAPGGALTAISQYACWTVYESLQDPLQVRRVQSAIAEFHSQVNAALAPLYGRSGYVMDVAVLAETVSLVELNPWGADLSSGSGLFRWVDDHDLLAQAEPLSDCTPAIRVLREIRGESTVVRVAPGSLFQ